jgi:hypothetical protein
MNVMIEEIRKTIVFLGKITEGNIQFSATGFLVEFQHIFHLVTAKHVVADPKTGSLTDTGLFAFFNSKGENIGARSFDEIKKDVGVDWIFHDNKEVDIAVIPFLLNAETDDVKVIPENMFLTVDKVSELFDVFFLSYQPGIQPQKKILPIIRTGIVSLINNDKTFYIDASAFPGNSGSPVFIKPSPITFGESSIVLGGDPVGGKFVGIIGEYVPYQEVAISTQTGRPRVIFEENTGLSKVWSYTFIKEIMESDKFKQQLDKLVKLRDASSNSEKK